MSTTIDIIENSGGRVGGEVVRVRAVAGVPSGREPGDEFPRKEIWRGGGYRIGFGVIQVRKGAGGGADAHEIGVVLFREDARMAGVLGDYEMVRAKLAIEIGKALIAAGTQVVEHEAKAKAKAKAV